MVAPPPILWNIQEHHLNEAAWLWGHWQESLDSALYSLVDVASGPEERLMGHLEGLVLGGQAVAEGLLLPALPSHPEYPEDPHQYDVTGSSM
jgi:hypothetical protein